MLRPICVLCLVLAASPAAPPAGRRVVLVPRLFERVLSGRHHVAANVYQDYEVRRHLLQLADWVLQLEHADGLRLSAGYAAEWVDAGGGKRVREPDARACRFFRGHVLGVRSQAAIAECGPGINGFIRVGDSHYFLEPLNTPGNEHVLFEARRARAKRESYLPVCATYDLDDQFIRGNWTGSDEDYGDDDGYEDAPQPKNLTFDWRTGADDSDEMGYFYDSAWETRIFATRPKGKVSATPRWLEIAVGVDYTVIDFHGKDKVQHYILALMNIVSAIYQDPSLESNLQLVITRLLLYEHKRHSPIKTGNARKSLENVNVWNRKLHATLARSEPRHDVAIWLTRADIGGPSGFAPVAGACDPTRSCALNRDQGLSSAFVIAHEMAHILGLTHDGDKKAGNNCDPSHTDGSLMAPMVASTYDQFRWSACSKKEFHKQAKNWLCLLNPPRGLGETLLTATLHTTFSMDEQCRLEFGDGYRLCTSLDISEPCAHLWCGHVDSPLICKTKKGPPLDGTQCGPDRYCSGGYCKLTYKLSTRLDPVHHNPQDGGWGAWSPWEPCSRSCGFGVQFRTRQCNNPSALYGGNDCNGQREEFQICGTIPCPEPLLDIRAEQCARLSKLVNMPEPYVNMTWLPYEHDEDSKKCLLICTSRQTGELYETTEHLLDGTPCSYDGNNDICVEGSCLPLGCDGQLVSIRREDFCGICGGDNSTCMPVTNDFQRNVKREISRVTVMPRLSRNILVECNVSSARNHPSELPVHLQLHDRRKMRFNLTVDRQNTEKTIIAKGTRLHYIRIGNSVTLWAKGPLLAELVVFLYIPPNLVNNGATVTARTKYYVTMNSTASPSRYGWAVGGWGPCSASCGGGRRQRAVACKDNLSRKVVPRRFCPLSTRPAIATQECNTFGCRFHWLAADWEHCSATCGSSGQQSRELYCVHHSVMSVGGQLRNSSAASEPWRSMVRPDQCPGPRPDHQRPCNRVPCPARWTPGPWSQCSETCGTGHQTRSFECNPPPGEAMFSCGPKPPDQRRPCRLNTRSSRPCKRKRKSCKKNEYKICRLKNYFNKYCLIKEYRKVCCKACRHKVKAVKADVQ